MAIDNIRFLQNVLVSNTVESTSSVIAPQMVGKDNSLVLKSDIDTFSDQYLIVERTGPSDIHIRAGGTINESNALLRLGAEKNSVEVSDSGHYIAHYTAFKDSSGTWHSNTDNGGSPWVFETEEIIDGSSYKHNFLLPASANIYGDVGQTTWHGDLSLNGNLNVTGSATFHNTEYTTTSAISVTNTGTGPALVVNQTGEQAIAAFYDDNSIAFYIDGKSSTGGYVGIGTATPNEKLTVVGNISATGKIYGTTGKFVSAFGNGTDTSYVLLHNLDTEDVVVTIVDTTTKEVVYPSVVNTSSSQITVTFSDAPSSNAYKAIVVG